jgi:hypothetical protein
MAESIPPLAGVLGRVAVEGEQEVAETVAPRKRECHLPEQRGRTSPSSG